MLLFLFIYSVIIWFNESVNFGEKNVNPPTNSLNFVMIGTGRGIVDICVEIENDKRMQKSFTTRRESFQKSTQFFLVSLLF